MIRAMLLLVPALSSPSIKTWMIALKIDPSMAVIEQTDSGAGNLLSAAACIQSHIQMNTRTRHGLQLQLLTNLQNETNVEQIRDLHEPA